MFPKAKNDARERNDSMNNDNGAAAMSMPTSSFEDVDETITWSWSPQAASKARAESKAKQHNSSSPGDYLHQLSYNCYDQTLDKLMGEFNNVSKRKRNWNRNTGRFDDNSEKSNETTEDPNNPMAHFESMWPNESSESAQSADVKDVNFWTKVFFNNNNVASDPRKANDSHASTGAGQNEQRKSRKSQNQSSNTAILLNSIISNLKDHRSKPSVSNSNNISSITSNIDTLNRNLNLNDLNDLSTNEIKSAAPTSLENANNDSMIMAKPSYTLLNNSSKSKSAPTKRKSITNLSAHRLGESDDFNDMAEVNSDENNASASDQGIRRLSLDDGNELNSSNSIFLQTLNDLRLDHPNFSPNSRQFNSRETSENVRLTPKERFVHLCWCHTFQKNSKQCLLLCFQINWTAEFILNKATLSLSWNKSHFKKWK